MTMFKQKKGLMILRAVITIFVGFGLLVTMVVLHPLISALVDAYISGGSGDTLQNFAVSAIEVFFTLCIFIAMLISMVYGE